MKAKSHVELAELHLAWADDRHKLRSLRGRYAIRTAKYKEDLAGAIKKYQDLAVVYLACKKELEGLKDLRFQEWYSANIKPVETKRNCNERLSR